jgi:hypothetical protein
MKFVTILFGDCDGIVGGCEKECLEFWEIEKKMFEERIKRYIFFTTR